MLPQGPAARLGVATITPLAVGETDSPWPGDSYLLTRSLDGVQPLDAFVEKTLPTFAPARQTHVRLELAAALGQFVARMLRQAGIKNAAHLRMRLQPLGQLQSRFRLFANAKWARWNSFS